MALIELKNADVHFRLRRAGVVALKDYLVKGLFRQSKNPYQTIEALSALNVKIEDGERIGIVGHNGAGKSTLLRLLAGVYPPTSGLVRVEGSVSSLLELGTGIELEATGWENIAIRGRLEGLPSDVIESSRQNIAEFSELGEKLNLPVRVYSSGMKVRLLFSMATAIEPEILLIDEIISAGDAQFQEKALGRISRLIERAKILVLTTHDLSAIETYCSRVLWLEQGRVREDGKPHEVVRRFRGFMHSKVQAAAA